MSATTTRPGVRVSVSELRRVLPDALRVMGIPLGQADSIAEMAIWTASRSGDVFALMRRRRAQMLWRPRPRAVVARCDAGAVEIDARGAGLLELGPAIFDCAVSCVGAGETIEVRVHRTYGDLFLPYLVWRAGRQGVRVRVLEPTRDSADGGQAAFRSDALRLALSGQAPDPAALAPPAEYLHAVRHGIHLTPDDFEFLMSQFEMLRIPTSERSRSHAG
jgi:hypothetical protein